jgi:chloramphenicol 3-O-phosphotransferase
VSEVFLITGPQAAGKTTTARLLAQRFPRGAHVEGDAFRRNIVSGRAEMTPGATEDALDQLGLRYRMAAMVADAYADAGFVVALDDVIAGPLLEECLGLFRTRDVNLIVLFPPLSVIEDRAAGRPTSGYVRWTPAELHHLFAEETPRIGTWLDNSSQTADETVDAILAGR